MDKQMPSKNRERSMKTEKLCVACGYVEGDGVCSDCITTQREEGRYEELWEE